MYTKDEVIKHNKRSDCWIILNNKVYNVTEFLDEVCNSAKFASFYC